ncbi:MAG: Pantothenate synthetase [Actinomycetota bacterium]|nr:Pantothenate synthetase [Actinomycetota bacterium]
MPTEKDSPGGETPAAPPTVQDTAGLCEVITSKDRLAEVRAALPGPVGVVMTMGALHEGHAALIRRARRESGSVLVTLFVNPLQFGPGEDLDRYPRSLGEDLRLCTREGADAVFAPPAEVMYPDGEPAVRVASGALGEVLEGLSRPGHFDGMLTVVAKFMGLTRPERAYFGQKDAQQLVLIRRMVRDLEMGVQVCAVPTVRESDGLALSSRNSYLSSHDRAVATVLFRALRAGQEKALEGAEAVRRAAEDVLLQEQDCHLDYLALVDQDTLQDLPEDRTGSALLTVAARVGRTRLIDNLPLQVGAVESPAGEGVN